MLTWTQRPDGWYSNGLRIQLDEPYRWLLLDNERKVAAVALEEEPLAVTRSLTECKREAELLVARRHRLEVVRRQIVKLLLILAGTPLLLGTSSTTNVIIVLVALLFTTNAVGALVGALAPHALGEQHQVFYQ